MIVLTGFKCPVRCVAFSPDGGTLAAGGEDCVIRLWDASSGADRGRLTVATVEPADVLFRFAPDGRHLVVSAARHGLSVWDVATGTRVRELYQPRWSVACRDIAFTADGRLLAADCFPRGGVGAWDAATWEPVAPAWVRTAKAGGSPVRMAVEPGGYRAALGNGLVVDTRTGAAVGRWDGVLPPRPYREFLTLDWAAGTGRLVVVNRDSAAVDIVDIQVPAHVARLEASKKYIEAAAFAPDGRSLVTVGNRAARVYDVATWTVRAEFDWQVGTFKSAAVSPDGTRAAVGSRVGSYAGKVVVWDLM